MANSSGKISSPVNQIADVKTVLGESVNTLSGLCTSTKINYWAKYKPVQWTEVAPTRGNSATWWKAVGGACGFTPKDLGSVAAVTSYCSGGLNGWVYARPDGSTYPYRLYDFAGYNHNATAPIGNFNNQATTSNRSGAKFSCWVAVRSTESDMVNLSEFTEIKDFYLGVYLKQDGGNASQTLYNSYKISTADGSALEASSYGWTAGTYKVYPFLANSGHTKWYSIPNVSYGTCTVVTTYVTVTITNVTVSGTNFTATVKVTNVGSAVTLTSNSWIVRPASESESSATTSYDTSGTLANVTLAAGTSTPTSTTVTISSTMTSYAASHDPILYVYYSNKTYRDMAYFSNQ